LGALLEGALAAVAALVCARAGGCDLPTKAQAELEIEWAEAVAAVGWRVRGWGVLVQGAAGVGAVGVGNLKSRAGQSAAGGLGDGVRGSFGQGCSRDGCWRMVGNGLEVLRCVVGEGEVNVLMWQGEAGAGLEAAAAECCWHLMVSANAMATQAAGEGEAARGQEMVVALLGVAHSGWERCRGNGGAEWIHCVTKAVEMFGDLAGEVALAVCAGVRCLLSYDL